ncbi:hypothetical protein AHAS_Ahas03G0387300 [Arachis hypogaea]
MSLKTPPLYIRKEERETVMRSLTWLELQLTLRQKLRKIRRNYQEERKKQVV